MELELEDLGGRVRFWTDQHTVVWATVESVFENVGGIMIQCKVDKGESRVIKLDEVIETAA